MPELRYELNDACFADLSPVNALEDKMFAIHSLFRNEDLSVNLGDLLRVVDDKLLTFVEGNPIGAVLNKTSIDQYEHPDYANISSNLEASKVLIKHCYDVVDVLTNKDAVYQDFELPVYLNNCEIKWSSNNGYSNELTIERIDVNDDYKPSNCKWITLKDQAKNKTTSRYITINGITKQMIDWCKESPVSTTTVYKRMRDGWNVIDALTKPDQRKLSIR
jgi:hypothetical protein